MQAGNLAQIIIQLVTVAASTTKTIIEQYQRDNNGAMPSDDEIRDRLLGDIDAAVREGDEWLRAHPKPQ